MDPKATLRDLIEIFSSGNDDDLALEHAQNLFQWLESGGFVPDLGQQTAENQRSLIRFFVNYAIGELKEQKKP